ncbi:hypothetical protein EVJ58_g6909 [Rhodofomes roseus]|nr:hypothetical protein EVJ58_g6909 [Rhodofomes roseus]
MRLEDSSILGSLPGAPGAVDPYTKIELPHSGAITAALSPAPRVVGGDGKGDDTGVEGVAPTHDSENRGTDQRRTARDIYTTHPQLTTVISLFETIATTSNTHNAGLATSSLTDVASLSPPDTRSSISPPPSFRTQPSSVTLQTSYNHHVDSGIRFYPGEPQPRRVVDVPPEYSVD